MTTKLKLIRNDDGDDDNKQLSNHVIKTTILVNKHNNAQIKPNTLILLSLITTSLILTCCFTYETYALKCLCNVCPGESYDCVTSPGRESSCFKSVSKVLIKENNTYDLSITYGCISDIGGSLVHLQCHHAKGTVDPLFMKCCRDRDYCNEYIPDPTELDDPRWNMDPPVDDNRKTEDMEFWRHLIRIAYILIALGFLTVIFRFIFMMFRGRLSNSSKDSRGSTCSLKADLDKFHHQHASSSASTHSYSVSICDDICHKPMPDSNNEVSFSDVDLTSGVGERMLNQRTMARAVGSGKTDHVGNGRFGRVFRGEYHGENVAVKAFKTIDQDSWERENDILRLLNHDNIVRFIASEVTSVENSTTEIWMFLEFCPYGSLCDFLDQNEILGPQQAVKILYSIINGLNYLHEDYAQTSRLYKPSIAHRDIKSKNILMKTPECCCIADFGHALKKINEEKLDYGKYGEYYQVGTIRYMAPEILKPDNKLNYRHFSTFAQADLYQYGLVLWEVCNRTALDILHPAGDHELPYDGVVPHNPEIQDMIKIVCEDEYRPPRYDKWNKYPMMKRLADLMLECWRTNSKGRMETLGVKKKLREMYDQIVPLQGPYNYINMYTNNSPLSPNFRLDRTKSTDVTL